jgi:hypothetical protein
MQFVPSRFLHLLPKNRDKNTLRPDKKSIWPAIARVDAPTQIPLDFHPHFDAASAT